jgi:hypothetical protein
MNFGARQSVAYETAKVNYIMNHKIDPEIIIFGSSVAFVHFDDTLIAQLTGMETMNAGLDGNPFLQYSGLVNEYLSYTKNCKLAVFAFVLQGISDESGLYEPYIYYQHLNNKNIYQALYAIEPDRIWKMNYLPGYELTQYDPMYYTNVNNGWLKAFHLIKEPKRISGYFPRLDTRFDYSSLRGVADSSLVFNVSYKTLSAIRKTMEKFHAKGIRTAIVIPPMRDGMLRKIKNAKECFEAFRSLNGKDHFFLDYSTTFISHDQKYFYNYTHMNYLGATLFSKMIASDFSRIITTNKKP